MDISVLKCIKIQIFLRTSWNPSENHLSSSQFLAHFLEFTTPKMLQGLWTLKWSLDDCFETDCLLLIRLVSVLGHNRRVLNGPQAQLIRCLTHGFCSSINICTQTDPLHDGGLASRLPLPSEGLTAGEHWNEQRYA